MTQSGPTALLVLLGGGLLASLFPCVYPLYPVTAAIVRGRGQGTLHAITYYVGLVLAYGALGVVAGVFGGAFNQILHLGLTQIFIGLVLVILSAATAGIIHLSIFNPKAQPTHAGLIGTALMGAGAGLLSSACVGPVVVSILVKVAASTSGVSFENILLAGLQMLAFGAGVGLPFLAIGLLGLHTPKSGVWMMWVQNSIALILLVFAYEYFEKGLEIYGMSPETIHIVLAGGAGLFVCSYLFQEPTQPLPDRFRRSGATVGVVTAAALLFWGLGPKTPITHEGQAFASNARSPTVESHGLTWYLDENAAYQTALREGKNVFVDFYGSWCTNCKAFKELTRTDQALRDALKNAILLEIRDTSPDFARYKNDTRFPELKVGLPFFIITNPNKDLLYKTSNYLDSDEMALFLEE